MALLLLFVLSLEPVRTVHLPSAVNIIKIYKGQIYLSPFFGRSIYLFEEKESTGDSAAIGFDPINFTNDENYRIIDFELTPFGLYVTNGSLIEKYYFASGIKETICERAFISSFVLTSTEEIVFADAGAQQLVYLDALNKVMTSVKNIRALDMQEAGDNMFALTFNKIIKLDEYGNIAEEYRVPEKMEGLAVDSSAGDRVFLFSNIKDYLYEYQFQTSEWKKIDLIPGIRDFAILDSYFVVLDNAGTNLIFYNRRTF